MLILRRIDKGNDAGQACMCAASLQAISDGTTTIGSYPGVSGGAIRR